MTLLGKDTAVALLEVAREVAAILDLDTLLKRIEEATLGVLDCERVTVFLYDPSTRELWSRLATGGQPIRLPIDLGIAGFTFRTRTIVNAPDASRDERFYPEIDRRTGFRTRSLLSVPLIGYDGRTVGVIELVNRRTGVFTAEDEELAAAVGALTGMALQRQALLDEHVYKEKLERDLEVARGIQRSLLPHDGPAIEGFDVSGWSRPAEATGGDFFDHFPLADERYAFALADVTGHGLGASLLASECRALVRANCAVSTDVAEILARANALLYADLGPGRFVTMFLGSLDPATARLTYVSAGHPSLLYRREAGGGHGECQQLDSTVLPLGVRPRMDRLQASTIQLKPGDTLLLLTDGFHEWENAAGEPFGVERVMDVVCRHHAEPAAALIEGIYEAVRQFAGGTVQADDLTALVIRKL